MGVHHSSHTPFWARLLVFNEIFAQAGLAVLNCAIGSVYLTPLF